MAITGSIVGYENNNELASNSGSRKNLTSSRSILNTSVGSMSKTCPSLNSSINSSNAACDKLGHNETKYPPSVKRKTVKYNKFKQTDPKSNLHLNSLWSIWYGVLLTLFQGYLAVHGAYRFLGCSLIQWKIEPVAELNLQIVLCGVVFILLPLFFTSSVFKVGNLANDGVKLATGFIKGRCSLSPQDGLEQEAKGGTLRALWTHSGPTAAFVHIVIAFCLLLPRLFLEARIIENGLLNRENIWRTELDFITLNHKNLVVLSIVASPFQNSSNDKEFSETMYNSSYYLDTVPTIQSAFFEIPDLTENFENSLEQEQSGNISGEENEFREKSISIFNKSLRKSLPTTSNSTSSNVFKTNSNTKSTTAAAIVTAPTILNTISISTSTIPSHVNRTKSERTNTRKNSNRNGKTHSHSHRRHHANVSSEVRTLRPEITDGKSSKNLATDRLKELNDATKSNDESKNQKIKTTTVRLNNINLSNVNLPKSETMPEIISATPIQTNSKIIEIKTSSKKVKRMTDDDLQVEIEPEYLISGTPINELFEETVSQGFPQLEGFAGMLQTFFGIEKEIDVAVFTHPPSAEFVNLVIALLVWSCRYPAVFWSTTKPFAIVFSLQIVASSLDIILGYVGISSLYKLQIFSEANPIRNSGLILNGIVTLSLFLLSTVLVIASSMIMYLYGHGRLAAKMRDRSLITVKSTDAWIYFAHCASLCYVLALSVVKAPLINDLSATYNNNLHCPTFITALTSVVYILLWIVIWIGLTAKRRWNFKLPPVEAYGIIKGASQPLLMLKRTGGGGAAPSVVSSDLEEKGVISTACSTDGVEDIYWPKLMPSSPKMKVTFNEVTSTSDDVLLIGDEHDGKRNSSRGAAVCFASATGEADDGDYATLRNSANLISGSVNILHLSEYDELPPPPPQLLLQKSKGELLDDNISEEGKLLDCVRDDSVTYASTRHLEPPLPPPSGVAPQAMPEIMQLSSSPEHLISPLAPVIVTVHTSEAHIAHSSTPRCLRRADSGVPYEALTPRSDTTSITGSTTSPPERAPSESSSGVHSSEEREEVVIRPRNICKPPPKPPQPPIQEEPYGRSTNMKMSSFNNDACITTTTNGNYSNSATLPLTRVIPEQKINYSHCSTMPLPIGCHNSISVQPKHQQTFAPQLTSTKQTMHTSLPNGIRYSNSHFLRRIPHVTKADSPYGHFGFGAGHHTFSKLLQDPLQNSLANTSIPEDRDSANFSMSSEQECLYATVGKMN